MNKGSILFAALLFTGMLVSQCFAQGNIAIGMKGGLNLANISGEDVEDTNDLIGIAIGGFVKYSINKRLSLQPEVYFTIKGYESEEKKSSSAPSYQYSYSSTTSINLFYIEIPVLGVFAVDKNLHLFAGPYLDIYSKGTAYISYEERTERWDPYTNSYDIDERSDSDTEDIKSDKMNSPGYGLICGAEYITGRFSIGARYSMGLSNVLDDNDYKFRHQVIQFLIGFSIP